jgi:predicted nucleic acid-binding protein
VESENKTIAYVLDSFAFLAHLENEERASKLKAKYPVAYADCFAASLAIAKDATVITGDPEFVKMEKEVKIEWI